MAATAPLQRQTGPGTAGPSVADGVNTRKLDSTSNSHHDGNAAQQSGALVPAQDHDQDSSRQDSQTQTVERQPRLQEYDLLERRGRRKETDDPEVEQYFEAKALFNKGYDIASKIPEDVEADTLKKHNKQILESTRYLVEAFLLDEKATEMSPRIMTLAQQYEKLLKLQYGGDEKEPKSGEEKAIEDSKNAEEKDAAKDESSIEYQLQMAEKSEEDSLEPEFTRESLILVIWLLYNGKQFPFCIQTLTIALNQLEPQLHPRLLHLRASCHLANGDYKPCIRDLERLITLNPNLVDAYSIMASIHMQQGDRLEAIRNFKTYVEKAHKDSISYSHALYALSVLTIQNATTGTTNRKQSLHNLRTQQAHNYYERAKVADKRFEHLYGHPPDMTDVKRSAMSQFDSKSATNREPKAPKDTRSEAERLAPFLESLLAINPDQKNQQNVDKKCNNCGSQTRKDETGDLDPEKKKKLLVCTGCSKVYYCSKECQKKSWKKGHKQECAGVKPQAKEKVAE